MGRTVMIDNMIEDIRSIVSKDDLAKLYDAVRGRIRMLGIITKHQLKVGESVNVHTRTGYVEGTIVRINRTRAVVEMRGGKWNVPFTMIRGL
jgi:hypothetical protein